MDHCKRHMGVFRQLFVRRNKFSRADLSNSYVGLGGDLLCAGNFSLSFTLSTWVVH